MCLDLQFPQAVGGSLFTVPLLVANLVVLCASHSVMLFSPSDVFVEKFVIRSSSNQDLHGFETQVWIFFDGLSDNARPV